MALEGGRSSSRLRERLARMFRPASLLRSTCNTSTSASSSSSSSAATAAVSKPPPGSVCSSSRALLSADAIANRESAGFLSSFRRHDAAVARTESFSTALDRLHRRSTPLPPTRFSVDAPPPENKKKEKEKEKSHHQRLVRAKKLLSNPYGFSSSDDDDDDADTDGGDVFSSDADERSRNGGGKKGEAAEAFFSSRSFSSDSSDFYTKKSKKTSVATKPPAPVQPPGKQRQKQRRNRRRAGSCGTCGVREGGFRPVVTAAEEQVRKGFAVVKRSSDPYADFRASMVEMVVGRQLFGAAELERLLRSYLSLNERRHHPAILQAFSDIWLVLHGG